MIRIENLWKKFGRFEALRGVSFDVPDGSAFAMIGANGRMRRHDTYFPLFGFVVSLRS